MHSYFKINKRIERKNAADEEANKNAGIFVAVGKYLKYLYFICTFFQLSGLYLGNL